MKTLLSGSIEYSLEVAFSTLLLALPCIFPPLFAFAISFSSCLALRLILIASIGREVVC
jgi:hypothetical protein